MACTVFLLISPEHLDQRVTGSPLLSEREEREHRELAALTDKNRPPVRPTLQDKLSKSPKV